LICHFGFREKSTKTRIETPQTNRFSFGSSFVLEKNPPKQGLKPVLEKNPPKQGLKLQGQKLV